MMRVTCVLMVWAWLASAALADDVKDWPQFRGPRGDGIVANSAVPTQWSADKNIAWKVQLAGTGWSQPIVWDGVVYLVSATALGESAVGDAEKARAAFTGPKTAPDYPFRWELTALDLTTGEQRWCQTLAEMQPPIPTHPTNTYATETPATDGTRVYVWLASIGQVFAYSTSGELAWKVDLGAYPMNANLGTGSSPIVDGGLVYVQNYNEEKAFVVALDAETGRERWRADRSKGTSWSTPYLWRGENETTLVVCGQTRVFGYNPASGAVIWELGGIPSSFAGSPVANGQFLFLGNNGPFSSAPLCAVAAGARGDLTLPKEKSQSKETVVGDAVRWWRLRSGPGLASMIATDRWVFTSDTSIWNCYDVQTGERRYRERLPSGRDVVASPLLVGDRILVFDEAGNTFVIPASDSFRVDATNVLPEETYWASPAAAGDALLVRGSQHLYCIRAR